MPTRKASAVWEGSLREGKGTVRVGSGLCQGPYSFSSRFEEGKGTNPEELIGAAHAGCFSMALSGVLGLKGTPPRKIETTADVQVEKVGQGFRITTITLHTQAEVPGATDESFRLAAEDAKINCPVSQALTGVKITLDARLKK
jgi:osmotically inducible protein OsmC